MDVEQRAREMNMAMTVEEVAKIISGAPFPSRKSLAKARTVIEYMSNRAALTPPKGYVLVPVEPTTEMLVDGFESEPDEFFSKPEDWLEYEAMSGCQQGHHRARLCWAAMLAARPEVKP